MNDLITDIKIHFRKRMLFRYFLFKHPYVSAAFSITSISAFIFYFQKTKSITLANNKAVFTGENYHGNEYIIYNSDKK